MISKTVKGSDPIDIKDLYSLRHLRREIELDRARLALLREKAEDPPSPNMSGMPHGESDGSRTQRYAEDIAELEYLIAQKIECCAAEQLRLERYIANIPESFTRQIFTLRFVEGLTWRQCAGRLGSGNDEKNISLICYRYLRRTKVDENDEK